MVYEVECDNCGDILDFGGEDPDEQVGPGSKIPEDAVEFDGSVYCQECVEGFVRQGVGKVEERIEFLETQMEDVREELGLEKHQEI